MRVYVGTTFTGLRSLHTSGTLGPAPLAARAVTPALREWYAEGDTEELEYVALTAAAADSLALLGDAPSDLPRRRVVIACEAPDDAVAAVGDPRSAVRVDAEVPVAKVASIHVDDPAADLADPDGWELMWFATQELEHLLEERPETS